LENTSAGAMVMASENNMSSVRSPLHGSDRPYQSDHDLAREARRCRGEIVGEQVLTADSDVIHKTPGDQRSYRPDCLLSLG